MNVVDTLLKAHARHRSGDLAGADALCRLAIETAPDDPFGLHLMGVLALHGGRPDEAVAHLRRADAIRRGHLGTLLALAEALARSGDDPGAVDLLTGIVDAHPGHVEAMAALALARLRLGCSGPALATAERACAADPDSVEALLARGTVLSALRQTEAAVHVLRRAASLAPGHARIRLNLANALIDQDDEIAAEHHLRRAIASDPELAEAWASLGFLLAGMDRLEEAIEACDTAIRLRPDFAEAYWNRAFARLRAGHFGSGWEDHEWRRRHPRFRDERGKPDAPEWAGGDLSGLTLMVLATQGLGDTIQMARYLPELAARAGRVVLLCARPLIPLLQTLSIDMIDRDQPMPDCDIWVDQMSLPRLLGTMPDTIPGASGYLFVPSEAAPRAGMRRIGLVCGGNPEHANDGRRSMPPEAMAPLRDLPGADFVSLQLGPAAASLARVLGIEDMSGDLTDLAATARIISGLDLVIAVDTCVAHLAGALGVPVWILLPRAPDWRWLAGRDDSPWYASARLFRQTRPGDWDSVIARVRDALARG